MEEAKQKLFDAQFNFALAQMSKDEAVIKIARKGLEEARNEYKLKLMSEKEGKRK